MSENEVNIVIAVVGALVIGWILGMFTCTVWSRRDKTGRGRGR
jgi:uncharacterized membrane protein YeaQ/YmgE (transglycosylase-associated protein family)